MSGFRTSVVAMVACLVLVPSALAGTLDELSSAVVRLVDEIPELVRIGDASYEVWLRDPESGEMSPRTRVVSGTAFFVRTQDRLYLVTAEHVARQLTPSCQAIVMGLEHRPDTLALADLVGAAVPPMWLVHPEADVALLPLAPSPGTLTSATGVVPITRAMLWAEPTPPSRDVPLTMLGFPLGLGSGGAFAPFSRESKIAGGPLSYPRGDNQQSSVFLLLQDPSVGGYSGSPVFESGQPYFDGNAMMSGYGRPRCIGVVHGTISDSTGGKFAAIVPAIRIVELIRTAEQ